MAKASHVQLNNSSQQAWQYPTALDTLLAFHKCPDLLITQITQICGEAVKIRV